MKITDIETHEACVPLQSWNAKAIRYYQDTNFSYRTIYVLKTDNGLEGLAEMSGRERGNEQEWKDRLVGTNPADWLANPSLPISFAPAIYDLVGKYNDVPAYKSFGPKVRSRVPVSTWTVSQTPAKMAEEVEHAVEQGYTWLKYHTGHFHNMIDQTAAMQEVAPTGFRIHYDMNMDSTIDHILDVIRELQKFPVAGALEDTLRVQDYTGYKLLRQKSPFQLIYHHMPLFGQEAVLGPTDSYMLGHAPVGQVIERAGLFEALNVPFMMQNVGGNITRAFVAHMSAAMPRATLHHVNATNLWAEDVVTPVLEVGGGMISVPEEPGLGLTLDREALARFTATKPEPLPRALVRIQYRGMPTIYAHTPLTGLKDQLGTGPSFLPGYGPGYNLPVDQDFWEDSGTTDFEDAWDRTAAGPTSL
jgi:L-alanine-DL-glutamate epimerase-like enolase superfamily enzyme